MGDIVLSAGAVSDARASDGKGLTKIDQKLLAPFSTASRARHARMTAIWDCSISASRSQVKPSRVAAASRCRLGGSGKSRRSRARVAVGIAGCKDKCYL